MDLLCPPGELHLTPVTSLVQMRPSLDYLDTADVRCKTEAASHHAGDGGEEHCFSHQYYILDCKILKGFVQCSAVWFL